ncbi:MAG: chloride channel protein, partial [Actinomycetia bacterium]|nr:chloride channel protein [Actinomycetes bacterium]
LAVAVAVVVRGIHELGARVAVPAGTSPFRTAVVACSVIAICASAYSLLTDRSPYDVASSGQSTLGDLVGEADDWPIGALVLLLVLKGCAYGVSLGALRGGPVFPAVFLGAAAGVLVADLPGYGLVPALAAGMAAATAAVLPLPVSAAVLLVLLLGPNAAAMAPIVLIAVVVAAITEKALTDPTSHHEPDAAAS